MTTSLAAVVVLYHPDGTLLDNINSYINDVDTLFIVDNSTSINTSIVTLISAHPKICYIHNAENRGIAQALNVGITLAIQKGYRFLLMMDQDSTLNIKCLQRLQETLDTNPNAFMASASYNIQKVEKKIHKSLTSITSGSMLRLSMIPSIGLHDEKLFIDYVDFEYTLRATTLGYDIFIVEDAKMSHKLGNFEQKTILFFNTYITNHPPLRKYYRLRNSLYVWRKYILQFPLWVITDIARSLKDICKSILLEPSPLLQLKAYFLGFKDFLLSSYGKRDLL